MLHLTLFLKLSSAQQSIILKLKFQYVKTKHFTFFQLKLSMEFGLNFSNNIYLHILFHSALLMKSCFCSKGKCLEVFGNRSKWYVSALFLVMMNAIRMESKHCAGVHVVRTLWFTAFMFSCGPSLFPNFIHNSLGGGGIFKKQFNPYWLCLHNQLCIELFINCPAEKSEGECSMKPRHVARCDSNNPCNILRVTTN